jgi:hypothetical protein
MPFEVGLNVGGPVVDFASYLGVADNSLLPVLLQGSRTDIEDFLDLFPTKPLAFEGISRRRGNFLLNPVKMFAESKEFVCDLFGHNVKIWHKKVACIGDVSCRRMLLIAAMCLISNPNVTTKNQDVNRQQFTMRQLRMVIHNFRENGEEDFSSPFSRHDLT